MAKFCFDESELSNPRLDDLNAFERDMLDDRINQYKYFRGYPVVGRVSHPPKDLTFTRAQLAAYTGEQEVPEGRLDAPIYIGLCGKVVDVSYGGKGFYGKGGGYHLFAGKDASRALAKMSFDPKDLASHDLSDLTPEQQKTLSDWERKLVTVRKYPVVGTLID